MLAILWPASPCGAQLGKRDEPSWNRRTAEHLFNRARFGATPTEIDAAVRRRPAVVIDDLFRSDAPLETYAPVYFDAPPRSEYPDFSPEEWKDFNAQKLIDNRRQRIEYTRWWCGRMLSGENALLERMALFWHGFFTTSHHGVRPSFAMIRHHEQLRAGALGSYANLLRMVVHSAATMEYLDNGSSSVGAINENLARELLELYSLGEGNYTESDVREVARALTGMGFDLYGNYVFEPERHDDGVKTIFGRVGDWDGDDVVDLLLEHPECARWVAGRMIEWFEGRAPTASRLDHYATLLRDADYEVEPLLRELFLDPEFYRADVVERQVQSPVDFMVGTAHRLSWPMTPEFCERGACMLGQRLFHPPNVGGWQGGTAWMSTSAFILRGNVPGVLLGNLDRDALRAEAEDELDPLSALCDWRRLLPYVRNVDEARLDFTRELRRRDLRSDAACAAYLLDLALAIETPETLLARACDRLREAREELGLGEADFLNDERASGVLMEILHWILSTPEAQLG